MIAHALRNGELGWIGLVWVALGWLGLGWVGLVGWVGLGWVGEASTDQTTSSQHTKWIQTSITTSNTRLTVPTD